jgi:hypothetical protein
MPRWRRHRTALASVARTPLRRVQAARPDFPVKSTGDIMQIGSIVQSFHIAVPDGAQGVVTRMLGNMAMVTWYEGAPGETRLLTTEPFFLEDLIDTGERVEAVHVQLH